MNDIKIGDKVKLPYFEELVEILELGPCPGSCQEPSLLYTSPTNGLICWNHCDEAELVPEPDTTTLADARTMTCLAVDALRNYVRTSLGIESPSSDEPAPQYKTTREVAVTSTEGPLTLAELEHLCALARQNGYPDDATTHPGDHRGIDVDSWSISTLRVRTT